MKKKVVLLFSVIFFSVLTSPIHAALWDRGGGLIYDDVFDITWLQDANYAKTSIEDCITNATAHGARIAAR